MKEGAEGMLENEVYRHTLLNHRTLNNMRERDREYNNARFSLGIIVERICWQGMLQNGIILW